MGGRRSKCLKHPLLPPRVHLGRDVDMEEPGPCSCIRWGQWFALLDTFLSEHQIPPLYSPVAHTGRLSSFTQKAHTIHLGWRLCLPPSQRQLGTLHLGRNRIYKRMSRSDSKPLMEGTLCPQPNSFCPSTLDLNSETPAPPCLGLAEKVRADSVKHGL